MKRKINLKGKPYYCGTKTIACHPATTINDLIKNSDYITFNYIIKNSSLNKKQLKRFLNYKEPLNNRIAYELSKVTGLSMNLLINLEKRFEYNYFKVLKEKNKE